MLGLLSGVIVFHLSILLKFIPYEITWGGKLTNDSEMYIFETISIIVNLFLVLLLLIKGKYVKPVFTFRFVNISLWVFVAIFGLNTVGNLFAETTFEKSFSIITLVFAVLIGTILVHKDKRSNVTQ